MDIYSSLSYKKVLSQSLDERKALFGSPFTYSKMANACRVQKTYLSKVLNRDGDLSEDQLFLACEFLGFDNQETDFTILLYQWERTQILSRKKLLKRQIETIKKSKLQTEARFEKSDLVETKFDEAKYYLDPMMQVIHICMTVKDFSENPSFLVNRLGISEERLTSCLKELENMKIIEIDQGRYQVIEDNLHLPKSSPLYSSYRSAQRLKSIEQCNRLSHEDSYNFSTVFSVEEQDAEFLLEEFLKFLKVSKKRVSKAKANKVYQLNFDLFCWT